MKHKHTSRNPAGLATSKPIALRLMPDELADAQRISSEQGLSKSALGRQCYLAGKELLFPDSETSLPRKRLKRGGGSTPAPTSSFSMA
jgi:hypothetical protein